MGLKRNGHATKVIEGWDQNFEGTPGVVGDDGGVHIIGYICFCYIYFSTLAYLTDFLANNLSHQMNNLVIKKVSILLSFS